MKNIGSYLDLMADMYQFNGEPDDLLNQVIRDSTQDTDELFEDDLDFVSAAADYTKFLKDLSEKK